MFLGCASQAGGSLHPILLQQVQSSPMMEGHGDAEGPAGAGRRWFFGSMSCLRAFFSEAAAYSQGWVNSSSRWEMPVFALAGRPMWMAWSASTCWRHVGALWQLSWLITMGRGAQGMWLLREPRGEFCGAAEKAAPRGFAAGSRAGSWPPKMTFLSADTQVTALQLKTQH